MLYVPAFLLLVILIAFHKIKRCQGVCDSDGTNPWGGCCANYYMDGGICKACPVGFFGFECINQCYYRRRCSRACDCSPSECNYLYGCKKYGTTDSTVPARFSTPMSSKSYPRAATEHHFTKNQCTEFNSTTIVLIIGGIVILLLILIIIFQIFERNRGRKPPAVHVHPSLCGNTTEPVPCFINDFYGRMEDNSLQASGTTEDI